MNNIPDHLVKKALQLSVDHGLYIHEYEDDDLKHSSIPIACYASRYIMNKEGVIIYTGEPDQIVRFILNNFFEDDEQHKKTPGRDYQ